MTFNAVALLLVRKSEQMVVYTIIAYCKYKYKKGKAGKASTTVQIAIFGNSAANAFEIVVDKGKIGVGVVGRKKGSADADDFVAVVELTQ